MYFNDDALATLLAIGISIMSCMLGHALHLNLCPNTAFRLNYSAMGVLRGRVLQPHGQSYFNDAALATLSVSYWY